MGKRKIKKNPDKMKVTREEFKQVMKQMTSNINEISHYLMEDLNVMFKDHVYPNSLKIQALINLLDEKGIITKDEINNEANKIFKEAVERAKKAKEEEMSEAIKQVIENESEVEDENAALAEMKEEDINNGKENEELEVGVYDKSEYEKAKYADEDKKL